MGSKKSLNDNVNELSPIVPICKNNSWEVTPLHSNSSHRSSSSWMESPHKETPMKATSMGAFDRKKAFPWSVTPFLNGRRSSPGRSGTRVEYRTGESCAPLSNLNVEKPSLYDDIEELKTKIESTLNLHAQVKFSCYEELKKKEHLIDQKMAARMSTQASKRPSSTDLYHECFFRDGISRKDVASILFSSPEIVIEKYNIPISSEDLHTLDPCQWINDQIVNFYMNMVVELSSSTDNLIYSYNTFFYSKLSKNSYESVRRWTKKVDLFSYPLIFIPINISNVHWVLGAIDLKYHSLYYLDSLYKQATHDNSYFQIIISYLENEWKNKKGSVSCPFNFGSFHRESPIYIPRQENGYDCGMFLIHYALALAFNRQTLKGESASTTEYTKRSGFTSHTNSESPSHNNVDFEKTFSNLFQSEMPRLRILAAIQIARGHLIACKILIIMRLCFV